MRFFTGSTSQTSTIHTNVTYADIPAQILGASPGFRSAAPSAVIRVAGPDARDFLHRMCSQDLLAMLDGTVRPAAFLNGKGKLLALSQVGITGDVCWVSTQAATGTSLGEMLERFHFTEDLTVARHTDWACAECLGVGSLDGFEAGSCEALEDGGVRLSFVRNGLQIVRFHGPGPDGSAPSSWNPSGFPELDAAAFECLRIASGEALVLTDSEPNTLALELPIADHISLTKGCYTGQEIVARIHTYGHTNRMLCRLGIGGTGAIEIGTVLVDPDDGDPVGRVMSAVDIPGEDGRVAFGFVPGVLAEAGTKLVLDSVSGAEVVVL